MTELADIIENLHQQHAALLADLHRLQDAIDILDPPPEIKAKPAQDQIKDTILQAVRRSPKTASQLAKLCDVSDYRARRVANLLVDSGTLETFSAGGAVHYRTKREHLKIVAGQGELK